MLGPTLIAHGSEEQKQRHLGPMLTADEVWCQLFSEPAAGSDLAGVQTRAKRRDDGSWRLSGQKVWTTNAQHAAFGLLLARTNPDVPKHKGLTMFIVPMDAEGVTVRPLRQISGEAHFNEVFLDDVRARRRARRSGPVDGGWGVGLTTLMFERVTIGLGGEGFGWRADRFAHALLDDEACTRDAETRHRFGEIATEFLALRFTGYRMLTSLQRGQIPGAEGALAKVTTIKAAIAAGDLIVDVLGPDGLVGRALRRARLRHARAEVGGRDGGDPAQHGRRARARPAARAAARQGHPVLRAARARASEARRRRGDELRPLRRAGVPQGGRARRARRASRRVEAAREALDGGALPDLWPTAVEAGWPGLLVSEANGGAGLSALEAMLVFEELGRVLASVPLLGHLPATFLLDRGGADRRGRARSPRARRAPRSCPRGRRATSTTAGRVEPALGLTRAPAPSLADGAVSGTVAWVPDAPGADAPRRRARRRPRRARARGRRDGRAGDASTTSTRSLGHVTLDGAPGDAARAPASATPRPPGTSPRR